MNSTGTKEGSTSGGPRVVAPIERRLYPSWPASSPWVTAVGATRFAEQRIGADEVACDQFGSGGGFSFDFDRTKATWQETAVRAYLVLNQTLPKFPPKGETPSEQAPEPKCHPHLTLALKPPPTHRQRRLVPTKWAWYTRRCCTR